MDEKSAFDPGPPPRDISDIADAIVAEKDPSRRMELFHEYLAIQDRLFRAQTAKTAQGSWTKTATPVKQPGSRGAQPQKVPLKAKGTPRNPLAAGVERNITAWCVRCGAMLNERTISVHEEWHDSERERLLGIAVELIGVLGGLDGGLGGVNGSDDDR